MSIRNLEVTKGLPATAVPDRGEGSVADYAVDALQRRIQDGTFAAGQRLVEADLTSSLGVSRGTLREAIRRLAATGVVELNANRGACVARASRREIHDIFVARALLEGAIARQVSARVDDPIVRRNLEQLRTEETGRGNDMDAATFMRANERFHAVLLTLSGSTVLQRLLAQLQLPQYQTAFFRHFSSRIFDRSREEHLAILDSLLLGEPDEAEMRVRSHVAATAALMDALPDSVLAR